MGIYNEVAVVLASLLLCLMAIRIILLFKIKFEEKKFIKKIQGERQFSKILLVSYKSAYFKQIDKQLLDPNNDLIIVFIANSWLFNAKRKVWRYEKMVFFDLDLLKEQDFTRILISSPSGKIHSKGEVNKYL
ncbi:hypothetical protein AZ66_17060 [Paenibacillus sp. E194]|uniref:hypothetical protein n=1 Tax=Paenibacillus sp. E194 TaxID=1458845 RepID=UPI0005CA70DD|nr:hypothetical protein [Paenibacillus sp. E194]KJB86744.1 hypothetical protein AZ66_17060 [Paenibacillus sp. E194]